MLNKKFENLTELAKEYAQSYQKAHPFPHIYLDGFFDPEFLKSVLAEFPDVDKLKDKLHYTNPNEIKLATKGERAFGENTKKLVHFLNSEPFLEFLQELTGIEETLIPDPYLDGGGFHEIKPGGFLKLHVDFHKHKKLGLSRRLNFLVYLNENWEESYGGHFELWEKDMSKVAVKILPLFNRIAMFSTTGDSWHGHPDPLTCPPDRSRKSLALYYYTNGRPAHEVSKADEDRITTTFKGRKGMDNPGVDRYNTMVELAHKILPDSIIRFIKSRRNK
jgi:Rps23 Pro-64 3,4-dihydroxylase Tpa1-like proline 4-hydroxylase